MIVPKMRLTSSSACSWTMLAASLTSIMPRSEPPAMESSTPVAPSMVDSSSGELMACSAAAITRLSPREEPTPIRAEPALAITERTSAKSTLITPGVVIRLVMPWTPLCRTSSAARKASIMDSEASPSCSRRSFGMTMTVSQTSRRLSMPS